MSLFDAVDPSGEYLAFVRAFHSRQNIDKNILYVHGDGSNGKTTLSQAIQLAFPKGMKRLPMNYLDTNINDHLLTDGIFLVKISDDVVSEHVVNEINKITANYPHIGFIIEYNIPPPLALNCKVIYCQSKFEHTKDFKIENHVADIKALVIN
jgi:hypothetical protein